MVQEVTTTSWLARIKNAFIGILFGIVLIIASFILIFWNEGHGLHTAQSLQQAQQVLISVANAPIDLGNNLRVIYFTGLATTNDDLKDSLLGISVKAIELNRTVEMYQWKENVETTTEKQMGGSEKEVKNYTYELVWSSEPINSDEFKDKTGHVNPKAMSIHSKNQYAEHVTVGDFKLPSELIEKIDKSESVDLSKTDLAAVKQHVNKPVEQAGDTLYVGNSPDSPMVGDLKISVSQVLPQTVSIIGQQTNDTLQAYVAPAGQTVLLLVTGQESPQQMILDAQSANQLLTWILRGVSLLMMIIGIALLLSPLSVLADVVPFIGSIVGFGTGVIAFACGLILWAVAIAIAWFAVRPLLSIGFVAIVAAICFLIIHFKKKQINKT